MLGAIAVDAVTTLQHKKRRFWSKLAWQKVTWLLDERYPHILLSPTNTSFADRDGFVVSSFQTVPEIMGRAESVGVTRNGAIVFGLAPSGMIFLWHRSRPEVQGLMPPPAWPQPHPKNATFHARREKPRSGTGREAKFYRLAVSDDGTKLVGWSDEGAWLGSVTGVPARLFWSKLPAESLCLGTVGVTEVAFSPSGCGPDLTCRITHVFSPLHAPPQVLQQYKTLYRPACPALGLFLPCSSRTSQPGWCEAPSQCLGGPHHPARSDRPLSMQLGTPLVDVNLHLAAPPAGPPLPVIIAGLSVTFRGQGNPAPPLADPTPASTAVGPSAFSAATATAAATAAAVAAAVGRTVIPSHHPRRPVPQEYTAATHAQAIEVPCPGGGGTLEPVSIVTSWDGQGSLLAVGLNTPCPGDSRILYWAPGRGLICSVMFGACAQREPCPQLRGAPSQIWDMGWTADGAFLVVLSGPGRISLLTRLGEPIALVARCFAPLAMGPAPPRPAPSPSERTGRSAGVRRPTAAAPVVMRQSQMAQGLLVTIPGLVTGEKYHPGDYKVSRSPR
ncbi:hypothetical protein PAPYR_6067 [Paratrimastix pyriformis]|uniref:Uncharacterized protein n=1 Tax=Paratrimastix pyriformis TaxID=342808 RepID=A0ABQ8UG59_9EUKA|nr:hypothetical protein PAPYR_6067 [Paratrimastix pyriformis]